MKEMREIRLDEEYFISLSDYKYWDKRLREMSDRDLNELCSERYLTKEFLEKYYSFFNVECIIMYQNPRNYSGIEKIIEEKSGSDYLKGVQKGNIFSRTDIGKNWFIGYIFIREQSKGIVPGRSFKYEIFDFPNTLFLIINSRGVWVKVRVMYDDMLDTRHADTFDIIRYVKIV